MERKEENLDRIIELIDKLPPIPDNIIKLRRACSNPYTNLNQLTPLLEKDPGLCADILHMANSVFYGINHRVETISEAVRYIGFDHLVDFVSLSFSEKVIKKYFSGIQNLNDYFNHSQSISSATYVLAQASGKSREQIEFFKIAGLLHDIGRLIIIVISDEEYTELLGGRWEDVADLAKKEKEILGVDHCYVGLKICQKWHLSDKLQNTIFRHHTPVSDDFCEEAAFIFLAHFVSMVDFPKKLLQTLFPEDIYQRMNLSLETVMDCRNTFLNAGS